MAYYMSVAPHRQMARYRLERYWLDAST